MLLVLESLSKWNSALSIWSRIVDEQRMRPDYFFLFFFDTATCVTGRTSRFLHVNNLCQIVFSTTDRERDWSCYTCWESMFHMWYRRSSMVWHMTVGATCLSCCCRRKLSSAVACRHCRKPNLCRLYDVTTAMLSRWLSVMVLTTLAWYRYIVGVCFTVLLRCSIPIYLLCQSSFLPQSFRYLYICVCHSYKFVFTSMVLWSMQFGTSVLGWSGSNTSKKQRHFSSASRLQLLVIAKEQADVCRYQLPVGSLTSVVSPAHCDSWLLCAIQTLLLTCLPELIVDEKCHHRCPPVGSSLFSSHSHLLCTLSLCAGSTRWHRYFRRGRSASIVCLRLFHCSGLFWQSNICFI